MKFDEKFKKIINEWRYTDDPADDYDDYIQDEREYLLKQMKENSSTSNISSYDVSFYKNSTDTALIVIDSKRTSIMVTIKLIKNANLNVDDKLTIDDYYIAYKFEDFYNDEESINEDGTYVSEIVDTEMRGDIIVNGTKKNNDLIENELFEKIEDAISDFFIENHLSTDIIDDFENNTL